MKMCNSEAMKAVKELEEKKKNLIYIEETRSKISFKEGEEKVLTNYDYAATRKAIAETDEKIRKIKHALAVCNVTAKVDGFNMTIGEALVYLAQLNNEYGLLERLGSYNKLSRRITANGVIEYTECLYEPDSVTADCQKLHSKICKLQVAIDRANLNNFIEV